MVGGMGADKGKRVVWSLWPGGSGDPRVIAGGVTQSTPPTGTSGAFVVQLTARLGPLHQLPRHPIGSPQDQAERRGRAATRHIWPS